MGLIDDKKSIFSTIGAYTSMAEDLGTKVRNIAEGAGGYAQIGSDFKGKANETLSSINNSKDITSFFMDMLNVLVGSTGLQEMMGQLMTTFIDDLEPKLKDILTGQFNDFNAGNTLPTDFVTNGLSIPAVDLDVFEKLKTDPGSDVGNLLYDLNTPNFHASAYSSIALEGTEVGFNNVTMTFSGTLDAFKFKPDVPEDTTIGEFFGDYINGAPILNKKEFLTNTMNSFYGSISSNQDKSFDQILKEEEIRKLIEQLVDGDDSFFINDEIYQDLEKRARELLNGVVYYDLGCGILEAEMPLSGMTDLISTISGMTDPFGVAEEISLTIGTTTGADDPAEENEEAIKNGFFSKLIKLFITELTIILVASPQMRMLLSLKGYFEDGVGKLSDFKEDFEKFKVTIKCITKDLTSLLYEFIFNLIVGLLVALLGPIIGEVVREKLDQFIATIKSLFGFDVNTC